MKPIKDTPSSRINEILEKHNHELQMALYFFESEDLQEATKHTYNSLTSLSETLSILQENYLDAIKKSRINGFDEDVKFANELLEKKLEQKDAIALMDLLIRLDKYSSFIRKEQKRLFPRRWNIPKVFKLNKKIFLVIGVAMLFFSIGIIFWNQRIASRCGLTATYFNDVELKNVYLTKKVNNIDFNWGKGRGLPQWKKDFFSIRFEGYLRIPKTAEYEFLTVSDDGVRLTIGNSMLINNWTKHGPTKDRATIALEKGYHQIRLDYFEWNRPAIIKLYWKSGGDSDPVIIPQKYFSPSKTYLKANNPLFEIPPSTP